MEKITYSDGSFSYRYQEGDYVKLDKPRNRGFISNDIGEWGRVVFESKKDRECGLTDALSFITIATAGVSTKRDSFQQRISGVPVWDVSPISEDLQEAITQAKKLPVVANMVKCVYLVRGLYGINYQPLNVEVGNTFNYDHGAVICRNNDGVVILILR